MEYSTRELAMMKAMNRMKSIRFWEICPEITRGEAILLNTICYGTNKCPHIHDPIGCDFSKCNSKDDIKYVPVSDLAGMTRMHAAAVSRLMSGMEKKGLITRSFAPDNHRSILVSATEKGYSLNHNIRKDIHDFWKSVFDMTSEEDIDAMLRILDEIMDNMELVLEQKGAQRI